MPGKSIAFNNILQIISQDSRLWSDVYKQRYGVPMPIDYFDRDKQRRCGQAVSAALCENPNPERKDLPKKHLKHLALYNFKRFANSENISDDIIREGGQRPGKSVSLRATQRELLAIIKFSVSKSWTLPQPLWQKVMKSSV